MLVVSSETCPSQARTVLMSTPARSRCVAVVCRLFDAQSSRHNTETSITLRASGRRGFFDGFSDPRMTSAQDYRYGTSGIDQLLLTAGVVDRCLKNFSSGSGGRYRPGAGVERSRLQQRFLSARSGFQVDLRSLVGVVAAPEGNYGTVHAALRCWPIILMTLSPFGL